MSDPPKSTAAFSFNTPATSGGSAGSGLFGQASNPSSSNSVFGSSPFNNTNTSKSLFGSASTATTSSAPSLFGNTATTSATSQPSLFAGAGNTGQSNSSFGGNGNSNPSLFGGNGANTGAFSGFSTPNKASDSSDSGQNPFGGANSVSGNSFFSNLNSTPASSNQTGSTTPATAKPGGGFSFGQPSTTPAGPPPSGIVGTSGSSGSVFGFNKPQEQKTSLFGTSSAAQDSSQGTAPTTSSSNIFGGLSQTSSGLFGSNKPSGSSATPTTQSSAETTGSASTGQSSSLFGNNAQSTQPSGGLFGNLNNKQDNANQQSQSNKGDSSIFPGLGSQKPLSAQTSLFPSTTSAPISNSASTTATTSSTSGLFGKLNGQNTTSAASTPFSSAPAKPLFSSLNSFDNAKPTIEQPVSSSSTANTSSASAPGLSSGLFGAASKPAETSSQSFPTSNTSATNTAEDTSKPTATLGASTSGPRPPAQSRLNNKTMDEIITRWASDLSKYQKKFQNQATTVATWDRMLVENSEKIQKLYGSTLDAERATVEVERQLSLVENDQAELESWLDHYERQVDEMVSSQVGQGDGLQGPDQERERTYKLAERLSDRLDEMGKDMTSMIEEINDASSALSKTNRSDDPLSQIVKVLNSHLSQLQQIDQGAAALQAKVASAQKASRSIGGANGNGSGSSAANDFYRSYMGRR